MKNSAISNTKPIANKLYSSRLIPTILLKKLKKERCLECLSAAYNIGFRVELPQTIIEVNNILIIDKKYEVKKLTSILFFLKINNGAMKTG